MRRIKVGTKEIIIIFIILALIFVGIYYFINNKNKPTEQVSKFEKFKSLEIYLKSNGYTCQSLSNSGASCEKSNDVNNFVFFRFDDGFQYLTNSLNYKVNVATRKETQEIYIQTLDGAFEGYQNKKYICTTDTGNILSSNISCKTEDKEVLDNEVYLTVVKNALNEARVFMDKSGYTANKIVNEHIWEK